MANARLLLPVTLLLAAASAPPDASESFPICAATSLAPLPPGRFGPPPAPVACPPAPTGFEPLPSIGDGTGNVSATLGIGYDADSKRLCFVASGLPLAPVLRVAVGHTVGATITNTLTDTGPHDTVNCPIDSYGGEGLCFPKPTFPEQPGPDGSYYPMMANEAMRADGTFNLHVHGLFVPPTPCADEVLQTTLYPSNWGSGVSLIGCQKTATSLAYSELLAPYQPAGAYWYHSHRHGESEHETQMGLAGAIVVEDSGDAWRASLGVTDQVLLVTDVPNPACIQGPSCDGKVPPHVRRQDGATTARALARAGARSLVDTSSGPTLDPRIDEADQAGECAYGASGPDGGVELWTLLLNGAPVPEGTGGTFPPDNELLTTTMQPGQRQIVRLVNASSNSFLVPQLVLNQGGQLTTLPLEVFARDGVGIADSSGNRVFEERDVTANPLVVPPAGRVEFVVHAPPTGASLYVQSAQFAPGCGGNLYPARRLLLITPAGTPVNPGPPDDHDLLENTPSLAPYLATLGTTATVHRTFVLTEYSRGFTYGVTSWPKKTPGPGDYDASQTDFFITEVASDDGEVNPNKTAITPFVMTKNAPPQVVVHLHGQQSVTEEWLIENATLEAHAFHMHQIHFQDITNANTGIDTQPILDTVTVPPAPLVGDIATGQPGTPPGYVLLRMTFTTQDIGTFVYHCHILEHEDNGMMGTIQVVAN